MIFRNVLAATLKRTVSRMESAFVIPSAVSSQVAAPKLAQRAAVSRVQRASNASRCRMVSMEDVSEVGKKRNGNFIEGKVFVVGTNIDTDQIIPADRLTLVPSVPEEYAKLGSYAMEGLPEKLYPVRYIKEGQVKTEFPIIVAADNFGCGSSREHAPIAIGAAGGKAVIATSYARIFFRNCSATGELYPWESQEDLTPYFKTGDMARIDFEKETLTNLTSGKSYKLNSLGDVGPVVDAGGLFEFARRSGMIQRK
mmetsp:Transcript_15316/g.26792  ORF Transcript_15316/g.26792 Transcript_15316/m.26792 type:complete len:254 (+) Transcript_15316:61-822(+)